jgi:hypothetical protein
MPDSILVESSWITMGLRMQEVPAGDSEKEGKGGKAWERKKGGHPEGEGEWFSQISKRRPGGFWANSS